MGDKIPSSLGNEIPLIRTTVPQEMCAGCPYSATGGRTVCCAYTMRGGPATKLGQEG